MYDLAEILMNFRKQVNTASLCLASSNMLDEEGIAMMADTLQNVSMLGSASLVNQGRHECPLNNHVESSSRDDDGEEVVAVASINIQGTPSQILNPILFSFPFAIRPYNASVPPGPFHLASTSAVAFFNMALALHTQAYAAATENTRNEMLLRQAKEFYLLAHKLLDPLDIDLNGTLIMVYLAICNNLAELHLQLKERAEANDWQASLSDCLRAVPPAVKSPVYRHFCNVAECYSIKIG